MMPPVKEPLAGLALLVIFGLLIWYNRPIESSPTFDPYPQRQAPHISGDTYEAWLWKDPFGFDPATASGGATEAWAWAVKREKHDSKSGKAKKDKENRSDQEYQDLTCQISLEKIFSDISGEERSTKILAPLVKVTPDTVENKEMRTRQRYAVIAGLIESGFRPQEPGLLHFCSIQTDSRAYDMRWEHYRHELKNKPDIIVAWIDSDVFTAGKKFLDTAESTAGRNLAHRNLALDKLLSSEKIRLSSEEIGKKFHIFDLNSILDQDRFETIKTQIKGINQNIELIKPAGMDRDAKSEKPDKKSAAEPVKCANQNANGKTGSEKLAEKLCQELKLRGIKDPSHVITITEQGSENAGTLASNIRESLVKSFAQQECGKQECGKQKSDNGNGATSVGEIRNVFYLKGSDGNPKKTGNQDKKDKNENQSADKPEHVSVIDLHHLPPLPIGPGQQDYFHRLAEEIRNVHDTVDFDKRDSGAKAVVILGSDFNDKLLIIEALRAKMPHFLILTTDLDAQMLYPRHWRSTRNVVVASHFDLLLKEKLQTQFPPFRDSWQTNIFYRTLSIVAGDAKGIEESSITFPRIFEVGRNGFVLPGDAEKNAAEKNNDLNYHPSDNDLETTKDRLLLLLGIALSLIGLYFAIRPRSGMLTMYLAVGTSGIFAIAFAFAMDGSGEPLSFTDGVSLWPTLFVQIIAVLLAGALFVQAICELEGNFCRLSRRYFRNGLSRFTVCRNDNEADECGPWLKKRLCSLRPWLTGLSVTGRVTFIVLFIVLIGTIVVYARNDVYPSDFSFWRCVGILAVVASIYLITIDLIKPSIWKDVSIKHWMQADSWGLADQVNRESDLWKQYYDRGRFGPRIARVVWIWLIFAIIETLLVYLLPPWPLPWRATIDPAWRSNMAAWTGVLSFTMTMLLLFFILDAVRLNFYWIKKLRKQHPLLKERITQEDFNAYYDAYYNAVRIRPAELLEKMVEVVAERTRAVDKLIYYPMLCIMLMLFAKITYFDNQDFPLSKGITFGAAISFLFLSGFVLRREANELKLSVKKSVRNIGGNSNRTDEIERIIKRIDAIDEGAFQPMMEQPVMQALLIILASIGLFAGEYLKLFG